MQRILLVKTTSLGDVIHCLPAVTDAAALYPGAVIEWVVEETYVDVVRLHPAVSRVLPVAVRRWRRSLGSRQTREEFAAFRRALAPEGYDAVIDAQGLAKSAFIARFARGERHGLDRASAREWIAALTYDRRHSVSWALDAVARNRQLVGDALGYAPRGAPDFGIAAAPADFDWLPPQPYCVCLTGTTEAAKLWPEERWCELGGELAAEGWNCVFPAGTESERARAQRIVASMAGRGATALVAPPSSLGELARVLAGAGLAVGVDTGLTHLGAALGRPTVGIYCGSSPAATGVIGARARSVGDIARTPVPAAVREAAAELARAASMPVAL